MRVPAYVDGVKNVFTELATEIMNTAGGVEFMQELSQNGAMTAYIGKDFTQTNTVIDILYRLQEAELIQCRLAPAAANGGSKKYYSLTHKGREVLDELILFWASYESCVNGFIATYQTAEVSE